MCMWKFVIILMPDFIHTHVVVVDVNCSLHIWPFIDFIYYMTFDFEMSICQFMCADFKATSFAQIKIAILFIFQQKIAIVSHKLKTKIISDYKIYKINGDKEKKRCYHHKSLHHHYLYMYVCL